jgi:hypothetical protein
MAILLKRIEKVDSGIDGGCPRQVDQALAVRAYAYHDTCAFSSGAATIGATGVRHKEGAVQEGRKGANQL